jgi:hypothetical protein
MPVLVPVWLTVVARWLIHAARLARSRLIGLRTILVLIAHRLAAIAGRCRRATRLARPWLFGLRAILVLVPDWLTVVARARSRTSGRLGTRLLRLRIESVRVSRRLAIRAVAVLVATRLTWAGLSCLWSALVSVAHGLAVRALASRGLS